MAGRSTGMKARTHVDKARQCTEEHMTEAPPRRFIKFNSRVREQYLQHLRDGKTKSEAAELVGVSRVTVYQYRQANQDFEDLVREAEIGVIEAVEDSLYKQARAGNVKAIELVLYNRAPDRWSDKGRRSTAEEPPRGPADPLPHLLQVLDAYPEAKAALVKRMELMSQ